MKKFSLLLCCFVAFLVSQKVMAEAVLSDYDSDNSVYRTLTITTTAAGQVSDMVTALSLSTDQKAAITKIVLKGYFNDTDLKAIKYNTNSSESPYPGFNSVTTVDMSDAHFQNYISSPSNEYYVCDSQDDLPATSYLGAKAIVGGEWSEYGGANSWNSVSYSNSYSPVTVYSTVEEMNAAVNTATAGSYAKVPKRTNGEIQYMYCQMSVTNDRWDSYNPSSSDEIYTVAWYDFEMSSHNNDFKNGEIIKVKKWYKWVSDNGNGVHVWVLCTRSSDINLSHSDLEVIDGAAYNAPENNLDANNYGHDGSYIWFWHYYKKYDERSWINDTNTAPGTYTVGDFDYNERSNHLNYSKDEWVRMIDYDYYQLSSNGSNEWRSTSYSDGTIISNPTIINSGGSLPQYAQSGQKGVVGGTIMIFDGTRWVSEGTVVENYSEMKFDYWKETLTTAITSNYANETISSSIFSECKSLTSVDYRSGNVTGFADHGSGALYASNLSVTIGKDVTRIDDNAFKNCDVLKTISFDTNYQDIIDGDGNPQTGSGYPKELTIGNNAFQECYNLEGIFIPNRVTSIGNRAFYRAGNLDASSTLTPIENVDFYVTFERRNKADGSSVSINYDCELTIGTEAFMDCVHIRSLSLPIRLKSMGVGAFKNTHGLTSVTMRESTLSPYEGDKLQTIPSEAFQDSHITSLVIPKSVTLVESSAFGSTNYLASITIQSEKDASGNDIPGQPTLTIKSGAFTGGNEAIVPNLHVYVDIDPTKRLVICEYDAFTYTQMQGQTDVDNNHRAVLHFDKKYWDYYQGDWKKGLAFLQSNLNAFKDGYTDTDKLYMGKYSGDEGNINTTTGKYEYGAVGPEDGQYTPGNGWQEFVGTSTGIDILIPEGNYIRTYSTKTPYYIPLFEQGGIKKYLMKIYRVTSFQDGYVENDVDDRTTANTRSRIAYATEVDGKIGNRVYMPAGTGLLLLGQGDNNTYLVYQDEVAVEDRVSERGYSTYGYNPIVASGDPKVGTTNLLYPTCIDYLNEISSDDKVVLNPTNPYPIGDTSSESVQDSKWRIFTFKASERKFYRCAPGTRVSRDKAYLKLPIRLFHWSDESGGTGSSGTGSDSSNLPSGSRISLVLDGDDNSELTGIEIPVKKEFTDDGIYTLQGVKLSRPQVSGLYIYKGKKIFVK